MLNEFKDLGILTLDLSLIEFIGIYSKQTLDGDQMNTETLGIDYLMEFVYQTTYTLDAVNHSNKILESLIEQIPSTISKIITMLLLYLVV